MNVLDLLDPTKVVNEVVIGLILAFVGFILGIIVAIVGGIFVFNYKWKRAEESKQKEKLEQERDKERIYNWLYNETKDSQEISVGGYTNVNGHIVDTLIDPRWRSTEEIASSNNLTVEWVEELCYINIEIELMTKKDILPNEPLEKKWAIKEFVR